MPDTPKKEWIRHDGALCLHGYPIRIVRPGPKGSNFGVQCDGRKTLGTETLAYAKSTGVRIANEMDEFEEVA